MDDIDGSEVRLSLPAVPSLLRVARLTAAGLAARLSFSFDDIEDTKIAIDELCYVLVGNTGREGTLTVTYKLAGDSLVVEGVTDFDSATDPVPNEYSAQILAAVVDEHEVGRSKGVLRFRFRKRRSTGS